jgi:hypothetical protein
MKQIVHENSKTVVDTYTGELIQETTSKVFTVKKEVEPFFLTYSRFMSILYNLNSLAAVKILWKFLEIAKYNTGEVFITPQIKKNIIESLKISLSIYNKSIVTLKEAEIISGERGLYIINPKIHWKGDFKTREKLIQSGIKVTIQPNEDFNVKED